MTADTSPEAVIHAYQLQLDQQARQIARHERANHNLRTRNQLLEAQIAAIGQEPAPPASCPAALNIRGEHFPCDWPTDTNGQHTGWAHANTAAEAIWSGNP